MIYRLAMSRYLGTRPGVTTEWLLGELRELPPETAAYMLATFPGSIEAVKVEAMAAPPSNRAMKSPRGG